MKKRHKKKTLDLNRSVVYEQLQLEAIEGHLTNTFVSFERKVRRWYSKTFSTPLHETFNIPWDQILINYYEDALAEREYNEVYEAAIEYIPELKEQRDKHDEELERALEAEQEETLARKKNRHGGTKQHSAASNEVNGSETGSEPHQNEHSEIQGHGEEKERQSLDNKKPQVKEFNLKFEDEEDDS